MIERANDVAPDSKNKNSLLVKVLSDTKTEGCLISAAFSRMFILLINAAISIGFLRNNSLLNPAYPSSFLISS